LLTVDSDSNGAVPSAELPFSTNADALGLRTVDLAGNVSPTVPVLDRQWVQLASRDSTNFHFLSELFEQPCPSPAPATAYSLGDDVRGGWTHRSVLPLTGLPFIDRTFLYWDPIAQRLVAAGSFDKATFDSQHTLVTWERGGWLEDSSAPTHLQGGTMQALAFDSSKGSPVAVFAGLTSGVLAGQGQLTGPEITRLGNYELSSSCGYAGVFFSRGRTMTSSLGIALVFDSRRARVLAFGGVQYPVYGPTDALVVVKNGAVTNVARSGLWPPARTGHSMSYDPVRDLVVLFGGADSPRGLVWGDTWLFDGTHWRQGPAGPPARRDAALAWDPVRRVTVLAGGQNGQIFDDVWEFDGLSWTRRGSVPPRAGAGLAWHPLEQRWFWAGGAVLDAGVAVWSRDTFVSADDGGWTRVVLADGGVFSPLTVPFAQQVTSAGYAYDLAAGRGYAFAGAGTSDYCGYSGCSHFEFNGNDLFSWSAEPTFEYRLVPVSGPRPAPRGQGAFTWSPEHGLVLVGGQSTTTNFGDTWRFADGGWQDLDASVPPRAKALLAWDGTRNRLVLQGGVTSDGGLSAETYEFVDAGWRLASTVGPATAEGAAMTWDPVVGGLVVAVPDAGGLSTWVGGGWASEASIGALGGIAHQLSWLEARRELLVTTRFANQANRWRVRHAGVWRTLDGPMTPLFEHAPGVIASPSVGDVSVYDARDVRPSIHVGIDLPPAVAGGELWSFTARALTGGEGFVDGGWTSGAELTAFVEGTYGRPRTNSAPPQHSAEIEWSTVDRQQLGDLPRVGNAVRLRVTPRGLNGQSTATVRLDDVELRWGFRATGRDGG
jgi:hypothetical protein